MNGKASRNRGLVDRKIVALWASEPTIMEMASPRGSSLPHQPYYVEVCGAAWRLPGVRRVPRTSRPTGLAQAAEGLP